MRYNADTKLIAALSPTHVAGYLLSRGWKEQGKYGEFGQLFVIQIDSKEVQVVVPRVATIGDFAKRMTELLVALAEVEDREPYSVLFDLTLTPYDVIRVRSLDTDAYGSVRFGQGLQLHDEAKRLVVAAAQSAASGKQRKAWKGRRPDTVNQYMEHVRLGQTENRSFSLTVLSPYSFDPFGPPLFDDAFGRRVTLRFGTALKAVGAALAEGVTDPMSAFESKIDDGVSADTCQALATLADNDVGIQVSVSWSPAKPVGDPSILSLTRQDAMILYDVARTFAKQEPEPEFTVEGLVEEIKEKPDRFDGSVVIQAPLLNEPGVRRIRVQFEKHDRELVYDAAKKKQWVQVTGELIRDARSLKLLEPRGFSVVVPDEVSD